MPTDPKGTLSDPITTNLEPIPVLKEVRSVDELAHWVIDKNGTRTIDHKKYNSLVYWTVKEFIKKVLKGYSTRELRSEAIGEAMLAYTIALPYYDPSKDRMFSTYIGRCIYNHLNKWNYTRTRDKRTPEGKVFSLSLLFRERSGSKTPHGTYNTAAKTRNLKCSPIADIITSSGFAIEDTSVEYKDKRRAVAIMFSKLRRVNQYYPCLIWMNMKKIKPYIIARKLGLSLNQYKKARYHALKLLRIYGAEYER